jgi:hypothetical protein
MASYEPGDRTGGTPNEQDHPGTPGLPALPPLFVPSIPPPPSSAGPTPPSDFIVTPTAPDSRSTSGIALRLVLVIVMLGVVAGGIALAANSGRASAPLQSPTEANAKLHAAAMAAGSFHYKDVSTGSVAGNRASGTQTGDAGPTEGVQFLTSSVGDYEVIVVHSVAYMRADLPMLENTFGYSASEAAPYVNRWIQFGPSDAPYQAVAANVTSGSVWDDSSRSPTDQLPQTPQSVGTVSTLDGRSVQSVTYSLHGTSSTNTSYAGTERIFFASSSPYLPYKITEQLSGTSNREPSIDTGTVTFSQWGEVVRVTAPLGAVTYSSLPRPATAA